MPGMSAQVRTNCAGLRQLVKFGNAWWSWSDSNQPPKCYGTWFESDQLPWSDTYPDRRALCCFARFTWLSDIESTTKALWNMVRVRPTTLVGHPRTPPSPFGNGYQVP